MKSKIWPQRPRKLPLDLNYLRRGSLPTLILKMSCVFFALKSRYKADLQGHFWRPHYGRLFEHPPHKIVLIKFTFLEFYSNKLDRMYINNWSLLYIVCYLWISLQSISGVMVSTVVSWFTGPGSNPGFFRIFFNWRLLTF